MRIIKPRIFVLALTLSLVGCASLPSIQSIQTAVQLGTTPIANPVTQDRLDQAENALVLVFTGLNAWKAACKSRTIPVSCRDQITAVQVYTRKLKPLLVEVRGFVRNNDQVNAIIAFNTFSALVAAIRTHAAQNGIEIRS